MQGRDDRGRPVLAGLVAALLGAGALGACGTDDAPGSGPPGGDRGDEIEEVDPGAPGGTVPGTGEVGATGGAPTDGGAPTGATEGNQMLPGDTTSSTARGLGG